MELWVSAVHVFWLDRGVTVIYQARSKTSPDRPDYVLDASRLQLWQDLLCSGAEKVMRLGSLPTSQIRSDGYHFCLELMSGKSQGFETKLWDSFPSCQGEDKERVLTVGGQVGQQHAEVLNHLRVILVEMVDILEEVEAAAALFQYCYSEGHQL